METVDDIRYTDSFDKVEIASIDDSKLALRTLGERCKLHQRGPAAHGRNYHPTDPAMRGGAAKCQESPLLKYTHNKMQ